MGTDYKKTMDEDNAKIEELKETKVKFGKQFEERLAEKNKKAAEMAEMEAQMKARLEEQAQQKAMMVEKSDDVEEAIYDKSAARLRAANRKRKAPRRGFVSREKTPADFDQPIRVH